MGYIFDPMIRGKLHANKDTPAEKAQRDKRLREIVKERNGGDGTEWMWGNKYAKNHKLHGFSDSYQTDPIGPKNPVKPVLRRSKGPGRG
jgi:hypothetical protein